MLPSPLIGVQNLLLEPEPLYLQRVMSNPPPLASQAIADAKTRTANDYTSRGNSSEGDNIDEKALKALIRAAMALNTSSAAERPGTRA